MWIEFFAVKSQRFHIHAPISSKAASGLKQSICLVGYRHQFVLPKFIVSHLFLFVPQFFSSSILSNDNNGQGGPASGEDQDDCD